MSSEPAAEPISVAHRIGRPVYRQLADLWREQIRTGALAPDAELPTESETARQYGIGREAVRQAIGVLRAEGLVDTARGMRTRVRSSAVRAPLPLGRGERVIVRMPTDPERDRYLIPDGVPIVEIHREDAPAECHRGDHVELLGVGTTRGSGSDQRQHVAEPARAGGGRAG